MELVIRELDDTLQQLFSLALSPALVDRLTMNSLLDRMDDALECLEALAGAPDRGAR